MTSVRSLRPIRASRVIAMVAAAAVLAIGPSAAFAHGGSDATRDQRSHQSERDVRIRGTLTSTSLEIGACDGTVTEVPAVVEGSGVLSVLGRTTFHLDLMATCSADGFLLTEITDVHGRFVAANGDRLRFAGHGTEIVFDFETASGTFSTSDRFVGGTGRFHDASGHQHIAVVHDFMTNVLTLTVSGSVDLAHRR